MPDLRQEGLAARGLRVKPRNRADECISTKTKD